MAYVEMYFDSSGDTTNPSLKFLTLSAFVSYAHVWRSFESKWQAVLDAYNIPCFHMTDANSQKGHFKEWEKAKIDKLFEKLFNIIGEYRQSDFECYSCTVALDHYRRAKKKIESDGHELRSPESICVNSCAGRIPFPEDCSGIKLFFDRNEPFMHKINRNWERLRKKGPGWASQIESIAPSDSSIPGIQAADIYAWQSRRYHEKPEQPKNIFYFACLNIMAGHIYELFDYNRILDRYPTG